MAAHANATQPHMRHHAACLHARPVQLPALRATALGMPMTGDRYASRSSEIPGSDDSPGQGLPTLAIERALAEVALTGLRSSPPSRHREVAQQVHGHCCQAH